MRRTLVVLLAVLLVGSLTPTLQAQTPRPCQCRVLVDGRFVTFDQPPVILGARILVPLRGVFEQLGATVSWDPATRTVVASGPSQVELTVGQRFARVNGQTVQLDVPAMIIGSRIVVPLRFVAEAMGATVEWDDASRTVSITSRGAPGPVPPPVVVTPPPPVVVTPPPPPTVIIIVQPTPTRDVLVGWVVDIFETPRPTLILLGFDGQIYTVFVSRVELADITIGMLIEIRLGPRPLIIRQPPRQRVLDIDLRAVDRPGLAADLIVTVNSGTPPFRYQVGVGNRERCDERSSDNRFVCRVELGRTGSFVGWAVVTDARGRVDTESIVFRATGAPIPSAFNVRLSAVDRPSGAVDLVVDINGGDPPFRIEVLVGGDRICLERTNDRRLVCRFNPPRRGAFTATAVVTDDRGRTERDSTAFTAGAAVSAFTVRLTAESRRGLRVALISDIDGGQEPFSIRVGIGPTIGVGEICSDARVNRRRYVCQFNSAVPGFFTAWVEVTDARGRVVTDTVRFRVD